MGIPESWDIAGFTSISSQLGKRISSGGIIVEQGVELSEDNKSLIWPMWPTAKRKIATPTAIMFSRFIELREGTPAEIRAFAKQWGRLYVRSDGSFILGGQEVVEESSYSEPVEAWRYLAARAYAVLSIAANLAQDRPGDPEHWAHLSSMKERIRSADLRLVNGAFDYHLFIDRGFSLFATLPIKAQRHILSVELNLWMTLGGLGLFIGFGGDEGGWQLELFFRGRLLAALALQLALTVSGAESPRQCSGCKRLYIRTKKNPKIGESNYCDRCGRTEAMRQADKRRREKGQEARRLAMEGKSAKEISRILKVRKIKTVRDWISKGK